MQDSDVQFWTIDLTDVPDSEKIIKAEIRWDLEDKISVSVLKKVGQRSQQVIVLLSKIHIEPIFSKQIYK